MSRQDANAAFALSSFLYGGNAAYIEDLYARYEADPNSVDAEWRDFFGSLKDDGADVAKSARGASWKKPTGRSRATTTALRARRPLGRDREEDRRQGPRQGAGAPASSSPPPTCSRRRAIRSTR